MNMFYCLIFYFNNGKKDHSEAILIFNHIFFEKNFGHKIFNVSL